MGAEIVAVALRLENLRLFLSIMSLLFNVFR